MPIRAFVSQSVPQLLNTLALLEKAQASGSLQELRVAGILTRTGPLSMTEVQTRYLQCRYELFLRAVLAVKQDPKYNPSLPVDCQQGLSQQSLSLLQDYPNPYKEKVMHVGVNRNSWPNGVFPGPWPVFIP